jgi:hypothetical protein
MSTLKKGRRRKTTIYFFLKTEKQIGRFVFNNNNYYNVAVMKRAKNGRTYWQYNRNDLKHTTLDEVFGHQLTKKQLELYSLYII